MDDIVDLGGSSQPSSTQLPVGVDSEFGPDFDDGQALASISPPNIASGLHAPDQSPSVRSSSQGSGAQLDRGRDACTHWSETFGVGCEA